MESKRGRQGNTCKGDQEGGEQESTRLKQQGYLGWEGGQEQKFRVGAGGEELSLAPGSWGRGSLEANLHFGNLIGTMNLS